MRKRKKRERGLDLQKHSLTQSVCESREADASAHAAYSALLQSCNESGSQAAVVVVVFVCFAVYLFLSLSFEQTRRRGEEGRERTTTRAQQVPSGQG